MKVVILAAGQGTRLRPYTNHVPKCLVEISGKTILHRQLDVLEQMNLTDISIVTGYKKEKLNEVAATKYFNKNYMQSNMVYSLYCATEAINETDSIIIAYGDIIYTEDVLKQLLESSDDISIVADLQWQSYWQQRMEDIIKDAESFKLDDYGYIKELGKKLTSIEDASAQYIGLMKFQGVGMEILRSSLNALDFNSDKVRNMYFTDFLQSMIDKGIKMKPVFIQRGWAEIDTVEDKELVTRNEQKWFS